MNIFSFHKKHLVWLLQYTFFFINNGQNKQSPQNLVTFSGTFQEILTFFSNLLHRKKAFAFKSILSI